MKNRRGGLIDIEFIAQYLQLRHAPDTTDHHQTILSANTTDALQLLSAASVLDKKTADTLIQAMRLWRNVQGVVRLSVGENFERPVLPEGCQNFIAEVCGFDHFDELRDQIAENAARCHTIFQRLIEEPASLLPSQE
jgi:glutamate-ammonia-ligase adenylyltransferase